MHHEGEPRDCDAGEYPGNDTETALAVGGTQATSVGVERAREPNQQTDDGTESADEWRKGEKRAPTAVVTTNVWTGDSGLTSAPKRVA